MTPPEQPPELPQPRPSGEDAKATSATSTDGWELTPREYVLVGAVAVLWSIYSYQTDPFGGSALFYATIFLALCAFLFWMVYMIVVKAILPWILRSVFGEESASEMLNLVVGAATAAALGAVFAKVF